VVTYALIAFVMYINQLCRKKQALKRMYALSHARRDLPINTIIDGELMEKRTKDIKDHFFDFDILFLNDKSVMHLTWKERRKLLEDTFRKNDIYTTHLSA